MVEKIKNAKEFLKPPSPTPTVEPTDDINAATATPDALDSTDEDNNIFETESAGSFLPGYETIEPTATFDNDMLQGDSNTSLPANTKKPVKEEPKKPVKASKKVVSQFPPADTYIYDGESIELYFYDMGELIYLEDIKVDSHGALTSEIRETSSVEIKYPTDIVKSGNVDYICVKYTLETGEVIEEELINLSYSDFPKKINVPFAYGTDVTMVDIYILNKTDLYKRIYVYD